jgi:hypothetical protein
MTEPPEELKMIQPVQVRWDSTAAPNPAAKGFASGLLDPLALALTLTRPFRPRGKESVVLLDC